MSSPLTPIPISPASIVANRLTATPGVAWLGLGLAGSSFFTFGNLANSMSGVVPAVTGHAREDNGVEIGKAVELWAWQYAKGKVHFPSAVAVSLVGYGMAARTPLFEPVRPLLLLAITVSILSGAFTLFMLPTNNRLNQIRDSVREARIARKLTDSNSTTKSQKDKENFDPLGLQQQTEALELLRKWKGLHRVRILLNSVGWVLGVLTLAVV